MTKKEKDEDKKTTEQQEIVEFAVTHAPQRPKEPKYKAVWHWALLHKKFSLPLAVIVVLGVIMAVPVTRYAVLGLGLKQSFPLVVVDTQTNVPVSNAKVSLRGITATTDSKGVATVKVPVGSATLAVSKEYYETASTKVTVPIGKPKQPAQVKLKATGRQVPIRVINTVSGKPVGNAMLSVTNTKVHTDSKGMATVVVPVGSAKLKATIKAQDYNDANIQLIVTGDVVPGNTFKVTPSGKVYFLSNQSGKLDVVKSNLDGSERKVVLAGTGSESKPETVLLATRDWKYMALLSRRDGGKYDKLFLINTADDSVTTMDEGEATFSLVGWEDHRFIYKVDRPNVKNWEPKKAALKSFDADAKKLVVIDQVGGEGQSDWVFLTERLGTVYVRGGRVLYDKSWMGALANDGSYPYNTLYPTVPSKQATFNSVKPDGSDKKVVKSFSVPTGTLAISIGLETRPYGVNKLYMKWLESYHEYEDSKIKDVPDMTSEKFYSTEYVTYLTSPSGKAKIWTVDRDGKLVFLVGDAEGKNEKTVATLPSEYQIYGWYSDDYLLVSKKGSELFILPASGATESQFVKVTDYYRPVYHFLGYGGGYGGL